MVTGMNVFRRHFAGFEDSFVLIGGAACDAWFTSLGARFRATKDIDMVLVLEAIQPRFFPHFWVFIRDGGYEVGQRSDGERTYFRFLSPATTGYPKMVEVFSAAPVEIHPFPGQRIVPVPAGENVSSLSAILMDSGYYGFIMGQRQVLDGLPLITLAGLIVLKARAWLDLTRRRAAGDRTVKEDDVSKHRSDVFRMAAILPVGGREDLPNAIAGDLRAFLEAFPAASPEWAAISHALAHSGTRMDPSSIIEVLRAHFAIHG